LSGNTIFITATEARTNAVKDQIIHSEARTIEEAVLDSVKLGYYSATVTNTTIMTSTVNQIFAVSNANINTSTNSFTINNHKLPAGTPITVTGTGNIAVPLTSNTIYWTIYQDSNNIKLAASLENSTAGIPTPIDITNPGTGNLLITTWNTATDYYNVWQNMPASNVNLTAPYQDQMATVINYFTNLGYNINRVTNTVTGNTFNWQVNW